MSDPSLAAVGSSSSNMLTLLTSTTSAVSTVSTPCDAAYNTVTYSVDDSTFTKLTSPNMMSNESTKILNSLMPTQPVVPLRGSTTILSTPAPSVKRTLTMCVHKKCPDGNFAINVGKLMTPNLNVYGCLYVPDIESANGVSKSACKAGKLISPNGIDMCVSTPQFYFPKI